MIPSRGLVAVSSWLLAGATLADPPLTTPPAAPPTASAAEPAPAAKPLLQWNLKSATQTPAGSVLLPEVKVTGHRDAFQEADEKLRKAAAALPCTGCGGNTAQERQSLTEKVVRGAVGVLESALVAPENAGEKAAVEDQAAAMANDHRFIRDGQDP
ncbi:MAG: hypothetical protein EPN60_16420 [Nevskiaceae bacterium]|nr:MAG: hypothetical protein EPO48_02660 [Nevskiaceae bacterium]TAM22716.1 MAG: hypothetical protein EPN60_16420 [Nevskiaceae bacterium]